MLAVGRRFITSSLLARSNGISLSSSVPYAGQRLIQQSFLKKQQQQQQLTTTATKIVASSKKATTELPYKEQKKARKERRIEKWKKKQERIERVKTRRVGRNLGVKKAEFRDWFDKRRVYQEIMNKKARRAGWDWKLEVAVIVERIPVMMPHKEEWEEKFEKHQEYLNSFGFDYPKELQPDEGISGNPPTKEKIMSLLPEGVTIPPRVTEADKSGDMKTTNRSLSKRLFLAVQDQATSHWGFPITDVKPDETLLDAAKRTISEAVGTQIDYYCPSNCPIAVTMVVYDDPKDNICGIKRFFMKVHYEEGSVDNVNGVADYGWMERQELMDQKIKDEGPNAGKFVRYLLPP